MSEYCVESGSCKSKLKELFDFIKSVRHWNKINTSLVSVIRMFLLKQRAFHFPYPGFLAEEVSFWMTQSHLEDVQRETVRSSGPTVFDNRRLEKGSNSQCHAVTNWRAYETCD